MTTSASWNFSMTAAQVIQSAFEDLGVVVAGGTVQTADSTMALQRLNMIVKQLQSDSDFTPGLKVWTRQRITLFQALGQQTYLIGPASTDSRASTQVGRTTVSSAANAAATVISITANTDNTSYPGITITMTSGDFVGIQLNDGTIQWTTISGTPGITMTVNNALTAASSVGKFVWWFTSRAQRFPFIEFAALRDSNFNDTPLDIYTQVQQYEATVAKFADADPTVILVEPLRLNTRITLNSQPVNIEKQIFMTVLYPAEDYTSSANDIAFPQEYYRMLSWELAWAISPSKGRWTQTMQDNLNDARLKARSLNPEKSILYFQCNA